MTSVLNVNESARAHVVVGNMVSLTIVMHNSPIVTFSILLNNNQSAKTDKLEVQYCRKVSGFTLKH